MKILASATVPCVLLMLACGFQDAVAAKIKPRVPSDKQLAGTIFENVEAESFQLKKGRFEGQPYTEGRPERLVVELLEEWTLRGDLNRDGVDDAAVFLSATAGSDRRRLWLSAVTGRYGRPASYGSVLIGDRMELLEARIADGQIQLKIAEYAKGDLDCPTQIWSKQWAVMDGVLQPAGAMVVGKRDCPAAD